MIVAGIAATVSDAIGVAALTMGAAMMISGAILPRVRGRFAGPGGVEGNLVDVLEIAQVIAEAVIPEGEPARKDKIDQFVGRTFDLLAQEANRQGWTFGHTTGARSFTLTKLQGDGVETLTVDLPSLLRRAVEEGRPPPAA